MNEHVTVEPTSFETANELRFFLDRFGPAAGRYLVKYPEGGWLSRMRAHFDTYRPVESMRMKRSLQIAEQQWALLNDREHRAYDDSAPWVANAARVQQSKDKRFDDVFVARSSTGFTNIDDFDLSPTSAETIETTVAQFVRVSHVLLQRAEELYFVDPYLDPTLNGHAEILQAMLRAACGARRKTVEFWISDAKLDGKRLSDRILEDAFIRIARSAGFRSPYRLKVVRFREGSTYRIHDRYLLCRHGAIRFEHGFQRSRGTQPSKVEPVATQIHQELLAIHQEDKYQLVATVVEVPLA